VAPPVFNAESLWIVGYGNSHRRDDGIGPYAAIRLRGLLSGMASVHVRPCHQLDPVLVEDLKDVGGVLFIDATVAPLAWGWKRLPLQPSIDEWPYLVHDFQAPLLLGLIKAFYGRCPEAWMVSVQGEDFGIGEGLSDGARRRADAAVLAIAGFVQSLKRN
jgi:hydrogenase maturation protease